MPREAVNEVVLASVRFVRYHHDVAADTERGTLTPDPSPRGRGELGRYRAKDLRGLREDVVVREAENRDAFRLEIRVPLLVYGLTFFGFVNGAVALDRELRRGTVEVEHVRPELMLPSKLRTAELTVSKQCPQERFGPRLLFAKATCQVDEASELEPASIVRCAVPLAPWERGGRRPG
jgi:hypothetical protein